MLNRSSRGEQSRDSIILLIITAYSNHSNDDSPWVAVLHFKKYLLEIAVVFFTVKHMENHVVLRT